MDQLLGFWALNSRDEDPLGNSGTPQFWSDVLDGGVDNMYADEIPNYTITSAAELLRQIDIVGPRSSPEVAVELERVRSWLVETNHEWVAVARCRMPGT